MPIKEKMSKMESKVKVIESPSLSNGYEKRYIVIDAETGEILDDAQGYGYRSIRNAYSAYAYKTRDRSKDQEKKQKTAKIKAWLKEHKSFARDMEKYAFEIECKRSWGPDDHFDAAFVKKMLQDYGYEVDFTAAELLRVWKKM